MARATPIICNFSGGEASPRLYGRTDLAKYFACARTIENFVVIPSGGVYRRPGLYFVEECKDSTQKSRLLPFVFSTVQAYVIETGVSYFRFYMNHGQILNAGATGPYELAHTFNESELWEIKYTQSADTMLLAHKNHTPPKLTRTGHNNWSLTNISFTNAPAEWTSADYPTCVEFFEQRSAYAASPSYPTTIWMSRTSLYEDMTTGVSDDSALSYTINAKGVNKIQWLVPGDDLLMGTTDAEWRIGGSGGSPLTPTSVQASRQTTRGSADNITPIMAGSEAIFAQRNGRSSNPALKLRSLFVDPLSVTNRYVAPNLTLLSEHITRPGIVDMAFQQEPDSVLWCVRSDGVLLGLTYDKEQNVAAWHRHITDGLFESVAVIPGTEGDEVWVIVRRTDGSGVQRRYVEYMVPAYFDTKSDCFFVDSGLTYDGGTATATGVTGLDHLAGVTVDILTDGAVHPSRVVTASGGVSLDYAATVIHVGRGYTSTLTTMDIEAGAQQGTAQGKKKRIVEATVRFYKTIAAKCGRDATHLDEIPFRKEGDPMDTSPALFSGDKRIDFPTGWDEQAYVTVVQDKPLPCTVLAVIPTVDVTER